MHIVWEMPELDEKASVYYNTAAMVGPDGVIGSYRKVHPWIPEKLWGHKGKQESGKLHRGDRILNLGIVRSGFPIGLVEQFHKVNRLHLESETPYSMAQVEVTR